MSELSSSLPVPAGCRGTSPAKHLGSTGPLQERSLANGNIRTSMQAPLVKPKPESRRTLIERANAANRTTTGQRANTARTIPSTTSHIRHNSQSSISGKGATDRINNLSRSSSVNSMRSETRTVLRPASANSSRPESASAQQLEETTNTTRRVRRAAWDTKGRLEDMEEAYKVLKEEVVAVRSTASAEKTTISTELQDEQRRVAELTIKLQSLQIQFDLANEKIGQLQGQQHLAQMEHEQAIHRSKMEIESIQATSTRNESNIRAIIHDRDRELDVTRRGAEQIKQSLEHQIKVKEEAIRASQAIQEDLRQQLEVEVAACKSLKQQLLEQSDGAASLKQTIEQLQYKISLQEHDHSVLMADLKERESRIIEAHQTQELLLQKLISEETQRRILHNQIQELKGNIRVFCRVRPCLASEPMDVPVVQFIDNTNELEVVGVGAEMSLTGREDKTYSFNFDKVFRPENANKEVFEEISQLVQSALDGYNVSIFAYGQTGSGKTHTMSADDGMIPRAVSQIYTAAKNLQAKGWQYTIEGSYLEIYCEGMRDLLTSKGTSPKLEIRHDDKRKTTSVEGLTIVPLNEASQVEFLLATAAKNRTVAATSSNERSSRSHSVFMLTLEGKNDGTGEKSRGVLNLIDLAGSERLNSSHAAGERLKETQAINKSLSCLADVIHALGNDHGHIPYRNSKLTYLLQYSLGGNSKTLMFVNISPTREHVNETLCSLRFATKVNATQIGTAKAQKTSVKA